MKVVYINSGWGEQTSFADKVQEKIASLAKEGYSYKDIKVNSSGNDALLIFNKTTNAIEG